MIQTTLGNIFNDTSIIVPNFNIYLVKESWQILYIGKSDCAISRLLSHIGKGDWGWTGMSLLGREINEHLPESMDWHVKLFDYEDCVKAYYYPQGCFEMCIDSLESELIYLLQPKLNYIGKGTNPPSMKWKYQRLKLLTKLLHSPISTDDSDKRKALEIKRILYAHHIDPLGK